MPRTPERFPTVIPIARRRPLTARLLPTAVTPGDPDLQSAADRAARHRRTDSGRRLEAIVALEARRAQDRRRPAT